jgi:hypothetical protein
MVGVLLKRISLYTEQAYTQRKYHVRIKAELSGEVSTSQGMSIIANKPGGKTEAWTTFSLTALRRN